MEGKYEMGKGKLFIKEIKKEREYTSHIESKY